MSSNWREKSICTTLFGLSADLWFSACGLADVALAVIDAGAAFRKRKQSSKKPTVPQQTPIVVGCDQHLQNAWGSPLVKKRAKCTKRADHREARRLSEAGSRGHGRLGEQHAGYLKDFHRQAGASTTPGSVPDVIFCCKYYSVIWTGRRSGRALFSNSRRREQVK